MVFSREDLFRPDAIITLSFPGRERALRRYEIRWNYREAQRRLRMANHPEGCDCPGHQFDRRCKDIIHGTMEWGFGWGVAWDDDRTTSKEPTP